MAVPHPFSPEGRLYLKEEELDRAVDLVFAASRHFWRTAEGVLAAHDLGPAHYRALAAIRRREGLPVSALQARLGVRKQSLARVLSELEKAGLIGRAQSAADRRQRLLTLTEAGREAERETSAALRERLANVFRLAGAEAVAGARTVWQALATESEP
ncbi:MAG: MarR family winged helix-turn-helix transcriptional regulator [Hyphomonadaceae bacterium]